MGPNDHLGGFCARPVDKRLHKVGVEADVFKDLPHEVSGMTEVAAIAIAYRLPPDETPLNPGFENVLILCKALRHLREHASHRYVGLRKRAKHGYEKSRFTE